MGIYDVLLGIDRAARDTRRRMTVRVLASDRLSAAIAAEQVGDRQVREAGVEYTHAMRVLAVNMPHRPANVMPVPLAA